MSRGDTIAQDIQFALRTANKSRGFVLAAVATLALGIGANTAIFSIVSGVLLRPLPFAQPDRLVQINQIDNRWGVDVVGLPDLKAWRRHSPSFVEMASYGNTSRNLVDVTDPERIATVWSDRNLFRMLGIAPMLGRTFRDDDPLGVAVLSAALWKRRFGADASCIGRKISLDREPYIVIGVMPDGFQFPYRTSPVELWIPWDPPAAYPNIRLNTVAGRLKPGVRLDRAQEELTALSARLDSESQRPNSGRRALVRPLSEIVTGSARTPLLTLLGAVALVLFIACANVANLLLARAAGRTHEIAVRAALGATRGRLVQQLLTECVMLSATGGALGLLIAAGARRLIVQLAAAQIPRYWEIGLDWRVFAFLFVASVATGIAFGILPALSASRVDPHTALKTAGTGRAVGSGVAGWSARRLRDSLVVAEIALSFVLLVSAGLLLRAFLRLQNSPNGMVTENVLTMHLTVSLKDYAAPGSYGRYLQELEAGIRRIPGVRSAGFIQYLPLQNWGWNAGFNIVGKPTAPDDTPKTELRYVSRGYFEALRIPLLRGRMFTEADTANAPRVILVNEALARRYFPNEDPVGRLTDRGTIIGLVGDVRSSRLDRPATPETYYYFVQNTAATSDAGVSLVVSAAVRPESLANSIQEVIHRVNPHQVTYRVKTMERVIAESLADINLYVWLVGLFAALAVLLSVSGVYAVISFVVAARTQEFGLRVALGAGGKQILSLVLRHGASLVAYGLVFGVAGTIAAARMLRSLATTVTPADPVTLSTVAIALAGVGLAACLIPARRATQVDPTTALRYE